MAERARQGRIPAVAQAGSLAGAIFAALVGADPLDIRTRSHVVQKLDYAAIALWVAAVVAFLLGAAIPEDEDFRGTVILAALVTTVVAGAATAVALLLTAFGFSVDSDRVLLRVSSNESKEIAALCAATPGEPTPALYGRVKTYTLDKSFLVFDFPCTSPTSPRCTQKTIRIPSDAVAAILEDPDSAPTR